MEADSSSSYMNACNMDMERLLEAFGSSFSLETITSAYSQASHDVDLAGVILYELQNTTVVSNEPKGIPENNYVSGISGGEFLKSTNGTLRIQSSEVCSNESLTTSCSNTGKVDSIHADIEDFLFRMLGDGFQLSMKTIHEVLGLCGYDLEKSMETLVDLSAKTLEKCDDVISRSAGQEMYLKIGSISEKSQSGSLLNNDRLMKRNGKESLTKSNNNHDLEKEILGALFTAPERVEELPKKTSAKRMRSRLHGRIAVEPMKETHLEETFVSVKPLAGNGEAEDAEENSFPVLRQAVKENWAIMREYYKSATDAFIQGDRVRSYKLMKEGQFYNDKAREADEKSAQMLLESSEDEMLLDISTLELKEAIKLLKLHISQLAGIQVIRFLKVTVGDCVGESNNGRLRRLVLKLLERASIQWTEAENGKTIVIQLDEINPKTLKFTK